MAFDNRFHPRNSEEKERMKKSFAGVPDLKKRILPRDFKRLISEIRKAFPGKTRGNFLRRLVATNYATRAVEADFSKFDSRQILYIVRSQCFAAARHLIATDDKLIDRELAKWHLSGERPGGERMWMQELSEKSPSDALKILRRYEATILNREKSMVINREYYLMIDRWIDPKEPHGSLALWSNDAVALFLQKILKKDKAKTRAKQSELKKSLGLISHRPPLFREISFSA